MLNYEKCNFLKSFHFFFFFCSLESGIQRLSTFLNNLICFLIEIVPSNSQSSRLAGQAHQTRDPDNEGSPGEDLLSNCEDFLLPGVAGGLQIDPGQNTLQTEKT